MAAASGGTAASLALADGSAGMNLVGKKSSEACRTMSNTNMVLENLQDIGRMFCHLEVESARMKFGTKYEIAMTGSPGLAGQGMAIWVDNSNAAEMKVYMCKNGTLQQNITISGYAGSGKAKGSMTSTHTDDNGSGGINLDFDLTQDGYKIVKASMKHTNTGSESGTFRNYSDISLADSGVSTVKMSTVGTRGSDTFSDQSSVLFNGTMGQALFKGVGSQVQGGVTHTYNWTSRSTFGADGITVAKSAATADIVVDAAGLPEKLAESFAPTAPAGWDCSGTTETISIDMTDAATKAAHDACNSHRNRSFNACWGSDFEQGEQE
ncbi:MAG: hypothetical protein EBU49_12190 [Proteobacteria bacterium]|nr:hypothetical protein [Pseudomonadota bacterium]